MFLQGAWAETPPQLDTPLSTLPSAYTPWVDTPQADTPGQTSPWTDTPLPSACWDTHPCPVHAGIWSTSGQYASRWNAFLFILGVDLAFRLYACAYNLALHQGWIEDSPYEMAPILGVGEGMSARVQFNQIF